MAQTPIEHAKTQKVISAGMSSCSQLSALQGLECQKKIRRKLCPNLAVAACCGQCWAPYIFVQLLAGKRILLACPEVARALSAV